MKPLAASSGRPVRVGATRDAVAARAWKPMKRGRRDFGLGRLPTAEEPSSLDEAPGSGR